MLYKLVAAVLLLTSSISAYNNEVGYENEIIESQMQKLMNGFVSTVDFESSKDLWWDHYYYLHSIMVLADNDVMYYDDTVDGGWSTWYPLSECLTISSGDVEEKLAFKNNLTKLTEQENWKRPAGKKRSTKLPTLLALSYENEKRTNHKWTAQLRVRYCTEELPMHGGDKCKGGNGMYEIKVFYFPERDAEYIKTLRVKRKLRLDYCNLNEAFMQLRKIKHMSKKKLRKAVKLQSTYYDLY